MEAPEERSLPALLAPSLRALLTRVSRGAAAKAAARRALSALSGFAKALKFKYDIGALHGASQDQLPITMMAAGLPQLVGQAGRAKSYAERLFEFVPMNRLDPEAAGAALCVPAAKSNVTFGDAAISEVLAQTLGYPYFLQEWGKHSWNLADRSPITGERRSRLWPSSMQAFSGCGSIG
jgi:hypothetical protein